MKLSTEEFVLMFGSDSQIKMYKERNKLPKKTRDALLKIAESMYENVEIVKEGRSNTYVIENKREIVLEKEDGRATNGNLSNYSKDIDFVVVSRLREKVRDDGFAKTMNNWMVSFGLIGRELSELMSPYFLNNQDNIDVLIKDDIIKDEDEIRIVKDYINYAKTLQGNLKSTLERLKKCNIIDFYPVYKAKVKLDKETKEQVKTIIGKEENYYYTNLDEYVVNEIFKKRNELMKLYDVSNYDVNVLHSKKEVVMFNDGMNEFLRNELKDSSGKQISIDYMWKAYSIILVSTEKEILKYLEKYSPEQVKEYLDYPDEFKSSKIDGIETGKRDKVIKMAEKQNDFIKDKFFNESNKIETIGERKRNSSVLDDAKIYYDRGYYNIFLNDEYVDRIVNIHDYYNKFIKKH